MGQKAHVFYLTKLVNTFKIYQLLLGKFGTYVSPPLSHSIMTIPNKIKKKIVNNIINQEIMT